MSTTKYTISRLDRGEWIWCGGGDTDNGTTAQLVVDGETYRVEAA